jgi:serine/threonine protein kinase
MLHLRGCAVPKKGEVLRTTFENFEILSQISSGGAGEVYLAISASSEKVAIKTLRFSPDSTKRKRFQREIEFCSREVHPNVIRILANGVYVDASGERPFYVMPLHEGTLEDYLKGNPSDEDKLRVFSKILDGVEAAHMLGITHRDIKPKNILVSKQGAEVAVADFGVARFLAEQIRQEAALTKPGDRLANFEYAAPEQLTPEGEANDATDVFALGLLLYRIFTGAVPRGANPRQISAAAPQYPYLDEIANAMIQDDQASRPQSIAEVKRMLIQRGHDFVEQQRLDELKRRVIPASALSDPLIDDPIRIVDKDWESGELILILNRAPHQGWIMTFRNVRSGLGGIGRAEPGTVSFSGNEARVPAPEHTAPIAFNYARSWIEQANAQYLENLRRLHRENEERQRRELRDAIRRAEESKAARARVLEALSRQSG